MCDEDMWIDRGGYKQTWGQLVGLLFLHSCQGKSRLRTMNDRRIILDSQCVITRRV